MSRSRTGALQTNRTPAQTRREIYHCFDLWGIEEYRVWPRDKGPLTREHARVTFWLNGRQQDFSCTRFYSYAKNLRAIYLILDAFRKAADRGLLQEMARVAVGFLPPGQVEQPKRPAWEVLQVSPDAALEVAEGAYRALAKKYHPDAGGSNEGMSELNEALEEFRREK